jgi:hypothetical protein
MWVRIPPGAWMSVVKCCVLSGRGLCDELITRPEESYRQWCVVVCDLETSWMRRPWPTKGSRAKKKKKKQNKQTKRPGYGLDDRGIGVTFPQNWQNPSSQRKTQSRIWTVIWEVLPRPMKDDHSHPSNNTWKNISNPPIRLQDVEFRDTLLPSPCPLNSRFFSPPTHSIDL